MIIPVIQPLVQYRKLPFYFQQQPGQSVRISFHFLEKSGISFHNLIKIGQQGFCLEYIGTVIQFHIRTLFIIVFIINLSYNLLDDILHCNNARSTSKLIDNDGNMDLVRLKITQKIINHLRFRYKVSRTDQCLPTKVVALAQMRKQILYIKNPLYIIPRFGIYRNTGIGIFHNTFQHIGIRSIDFQVHHIQPGSHHFLSRFLTKTDNTFQNIAFL